MRGKLRRADYEKRATPCCGRKPLIYMRERHQFCTRCDRAYDLDTEQQVSNWAWKHWGDQWRPTYPDSDGAKMPGRAGQTRAALNQKGDADGR